MESSQSVTKFENIPTEIILLILSYLDGPGIMSIRKTCQRISCITADRSLWMSQYQAYSEHCPRLESLVLSAHVAELRWLTQRGPPRLLYTGNKDLQVVDTGFFGTLLSIDVLLGRWLVAVHQEGMITLWDLLPTAQGLQDRDFGVGFRWTDGRSAIPKCKFKTELQGIGSCTSSVDAGNSIAYWQERLLTLMPMCVSSPNVTRLVRLNLAPDTLPIDSLVTIPTPNATYKVAAICPSSQTIIFSQPATLRCLRWSSCSFWKVILTEETDEELWNGVIGIKYLTPSHVLCMKARSVELYMLLDTSLLERSKLSSSASSDSGVLDTEVVRHRFGEMTFRGVSFSDPKVVESPENTVVTVSFLSYDVLRGLFHYQVTATLPRPSAVDSSMSGKLSATSSHHALPPMDMSVRLLAAHKMAQLVNTATFLATPGTDTPTRSMFTTGARGFVSACVLGPQGRRGVWIERQRGNMDRTVFGFSRAKTEGQQGSAEAEASAEEQALEGTRLHEVRNSYDLGGACVRLARERRFARHRED
ncbi:hypothetical protein EIP86_009789 [Pleurotus ostreatoroseus]|nr:hypothetical protein EIP86_009789 [Pleurotus ostreatoroseus]